MKIIEKIKKRNKRKYEKVKLYEDKLKNGEILTPQEKKIYKYYKREIRHYKGNKASGKNMVVLLFSIAVIFHLYETIGWYNLLIYIIVNIIGIYIYIYFEK